MRQGPPAGLDALVDPIGAAAFAQSWWGSRSLVLPGPPDRFAGLVDCEDIGRILHFARPKPPQSMLLVKASRHCDVNWTNPDGSPRLDRVRAAFRDGYSIVLNDVGSFWEPVFRFCAALTADLHHPVNANLYITPPGTQAFDPHYDIMDVFVLQLAGSKYWEVRGAARELPMTDEHAAVKSDDLPPIVWSGDLEAGTVLYIPRGHVHAARATQTVSYHLTIGVHVVTWLDVLSAAMASARQDSRYRQALPPGFLHGTDGLVETMASLASGLGRFLTLEEGLAGLGPRLLSAQPPPREDLLGPAPEPTLDMPLRRRGGVFGHVSLRSGMAVFQYSGGVMAGPAKIAPALRHVAMQAQWTPRQLPGDLAEKERLVLAGRLLRDGIVEAAA